MEDLTRSGRVGELNLASRRAEEAGDAASSQRTRRRPVGRNSRDQLSKSGPMANSNLPRRIIKSSNCVPPNYMSQQFDINERMRSILIDCLIESVSLFEIRASAMDHRGMLEYGDMEDEECPDEFQCCVCLDIMYKPVVLACGHISCFWCVFKAMDNIQESHCPVCRNPYNHFPRICNMLHGLLLKLYPSAYKRRERLLAEEEKKSGHASPQCKGNLIDSQFTEELDVWDSSSVIGAVHVESNATCEGGHSIVQVPGEVNTITVPTTSSSHNITDKANCTVKQSNRVPITDLQCAVCKKLLCRPFEMPRLFYNRSESNSNDSKHFFLHYFGNPRTQSYGYVKYRISMSN